MKAFGGSFLIGIGALLCFVGIPVGAAIMQATSSMILGLICGGAVSLFGYLLIAGILEWWIRSV